MKEFLQSDRRNFSSARLMFMVGILWSMTISTIGAFSMGWSSGELIAVFSATSGVFVALKLGQKPMEKNELLKNS